MTSKLKHYHVITEILRCSKLEEINLFAIIRLYYCLDCMLPLEIRPDQMFQTFGHMITFTLSKHSYHVRVHFFLPRAMYVQSL